MRSDEQIENYAAKWADANRKAYNTLEYVRADALGETITREALRQFAETAFMPHTVRLYDQFGRPVDVPSTAPKIGHAITVKRPARFGASSR